MTDKFIIKSENNIKHNLHLNEFKKFIYDNKIIIVGIGLVLSKHIDALATSFINHIILPIFKINKESNNSDIEKIMSRTIVIFDRTFDYGNFLFDIIEFSIILYILFIVSIYADNLLH